MKLQFFDQSEQYFTGTLLTYLPTPITRQKVHNFCIKNQAAFGGKNPLSDQRGEMMMSGAVVRQNRAPPVAPTRYPRFPPKKKINRRYTGTIHMNIHIKIVQQRILPPFLPHRRQQQPSIISQSINANKFFV